MENCKMELENCRRKIANNKKYRITMEKGYVVELQISIMLL